MKTIEHKTRSEKKFRGWFPELDKFFEHFGVERFEVVVKKGEKDPGRYVFEKKTSKKPRTPTIFDID